MAAELIFLSRFPLVLSQTSDASITNARGDMHKLCFEKHLTNFEGFFWRQLGALLIQARVCFNRVEDGRAGGLN